MMLHFLFALTFIIQSASAKFIPPGRERDPLAWHESQLGLHLQASNYTNSTFETNLDHFNKSDTRKFNIQYWVNDKYQNKKSDKGPVFIYICGEWTCAPPSDSASAMAFGASNGAILMALEHRYYGSSQPFSDAQGGWSYENLKWLNVTQAIEDIELFIQTVVKKDYGTTREILLIGGSYPGALVAWFKKAHPSSVSAVWSSSGVVHAIEDFKMYDFDIYNTARHSPECIEMIWNVTADIEKVFTFGSPDAKAAIFDTFAVTNQSMLFQDFMSYLADLFAGGVQNGQRTEMCAFLTAEDMKTDTYAKLYAYGKARGLEPDDYDPSKILSNTSVDSTKAARQWTYQICAEFGWFQVPNAVQPMRSLVLNVTYWQDLCRRVFSPDIPAPGVQLVNEQYGGLDISVQNVYFFTAAEDPWQYAGLRRLSNRENMKAWHVMCTDCSHCVDLHAPSGSDPISLRDGWADAKKTIGQWMNLSQEKDGDQIESVKNVEFVQN